MFGLLQSIFSQPLVNLLLVLFWGLHDIGLAILVLTFLIRLALAPLSFKQARLQQKKQQFQPQIARLQRQYQGDQQGFLQAQQALFKEHQISLFDGCLPLLLQVPILYGLFFALQQGLQGTVAEINCQLYPFLRFAAITPPGGLHPLDSGLHWFSWLPGHPMLNLSQADPTHALPLLAAFLTFLQLRMAQPERQPSGNLSSLGANTEVQQATHSAIGLLLVIGPLVTLWIGWHAAAGLALYWAASTLVQIGQQYLISGWGGLFRGIPRLKQWAREQQSQRKARLMTRLEAVDAERGPAVPPMLGAGDGHLQSNRPPATQRNAQAHREQASNNAAKTRGGPSQAPQISNPSQKTLKLPRPRQDKQGKRKPLIGTRTPGGKAKTSRPQKGWSRRKKRHR